LTQTFESGGVEKEKILPSGSAAFALGVMVTIAMPTGITGFVAGLEKLRKPLG
jgi:hypothetical protein